MWAIVRFNIWPPKPRAQTTRQLAQKKRATFRRNARAIMYVCMCVYICVYIFMYIYPEPRTPKARSPIPNNYSGYTSGRILPGTITLRLVTGRVNRSPRNTNPNNLSGCHPRRLRIPMTPAAIIPIQKMWILAPYSNPNKFKHPEPD